MSVRRTAIIVGLLAMAALAFVGGRLTASPRKPPHHGDAFHAQAAKQTELPPAAPVDVRNIAETPFATTYQSLKAASPELLSAWAKDLEKITATPTRWAAITTFFKTLIQVNPAAAKKMILELTKENRWQAMIAIREAAPPRAMKEVAEVLLSYDRIEISGCSWDFLREALNEWSRSDPIAVKEFIEKHADAQMRSYFPGLVRNWAAYDPEAARDWLVQQLAQRPARQTTSEDELSSSEDYEWESLPEAMVKAWLEGFIENDREAALDYLVAHDDKEIEKAIPAVVAALFLESPEEARVFILRLPETRRAEALAGMTENADRFAWGDVDDRTRSPDFVANWMLQFPSELWSKNIGRVLLEWRFKDAPKMLTWMEDLPADTQSAVVANYDFYLTSDSAEMDFQMVMEIANIGLRDQLLERLMLQAESGRKAILASLEKAQLPAEQKARLSALIPRDRWATNPSDEDDDE